MRPLFKFRGPSALPSMRGISRRRSIRLTAEGTKFLLFTFGIGLAAINTGNNLFYLLLAMMLSLIVTSGILSEQCLRRLEFHRHVPDLIMANEPATLTVSMTNKQSHLASFSIRLFDVVAGRDVDRGLLIHHLPPHGSVLLSYPVLAVKRGRLHLEGIRAQTQFPFGLFLKKGFYAVGADLLVSPPIKPLALRFVDELVGEGQGNSLPRRGPGTQLYNLRLYQPGDDSRSIHWMTTARTSQLIVRETEAEDQRRVTVYLSLVADDDRESLFERSVTFVASLVWQLTDRAYPVRLIAGKEDSGFGSGPAHLCTMLRLLAICERQRPGDGSTDQDGHQPPPVHESEQGFRVAVVPGLERPSPGTAIWADRVLTARQLEEFTHAF